MNNVALILVYNHQYNKNINILEDIYKDRFTNIYHLVPFYTGDKTNVIAVYENSYYFQGYIAQGFSQFFKQEYKHYIFAADDLLLNPEINQTNYQTHFGLEDDTCFIPDFINLDEVKQDMVADGLLKPWPRVEEAFNYKLDMAGIEVKPFLPDYDTAKKAFDKFNLSLKPMQFHQIWQTPKNLTGYKSMGVREVLRMAKNKLLKQKHYLPYPLVGAYSDIAVVSADAIKMFCHYCGITAATNLFVEVGLPTSLVLVAKKIVTEESLKLKGKALWTKEDHKFLDKYNRNLPSLLANFPADLLYIHPIKLSQWQV